MFELWLRAGDGDARKVQSVRLYPDPAGDAPPTLSAAVETAAGAGGRPTMATLIENDAPGMAVPPSVAQMPLTATGAATSGAPVPTPAPAPAPTGRHSPPARTPR